MKSEAQLTRHQLLFRQVVLIYQMPKIGSQTIEATLRRYAVPWPILRFHYLSPAFASTLRHGLTSPQADPAWKQNAQLQLNSLREKARAMRWRRLLCFCGFKLPKLYVITGVRELIGLVLASIFENYAYFAPKIEEMTVEKCRNALMHPKTFKTLRDWFDLELKPFTGVNVFRNPFPYEHGYAIYENRFARVLVYRFESMNQLPKLLSQFLHLEIPALVNSNLGDSKQYADQYRSVRDQLSLPAEFVTELYDTRMMRHFYSGAERGQYLAKWTQPQLKTGCWY
jgi:Putative capsular polysaccharide synthesis protein